MEGLYMEGSVENSAELLPALPEADERSRVACVHEDFTDSMAFLLITTNSGKQEGLIVPKVGLFSDVEIDPII